MFLRLLMAMTLIPIVELIILIDVHQLIAKIAGPSKALLVTVGCVILTGIIGAKLAKSQGFKLVKTAQAQLSQGILPDQALLEGVLLIAGSVMLLTPGYLTDLLGLGLLLPATRKVLANWLSKRLSQQHHRGRLQVYYYQNGPSNRRGSQGFRQTSHEDIIDIEPIEDRSSEADTTPRQKH